ncbi:MAG: two-component system response regulator [Bacteroidetes bacterium]|nr:MAG: two-component system response regulator [Bacteroidota bacterium]
MDFLILNVFLPMKKQILAVDDSKAIRFLLQTVLGKAYNVITVPDGCSAMYWLSKRNFPDLIIADPQLPDMENWELVQQLSSSGIYNSIPVVALSGLSKEETDAKCLEYGVLKYFMKPFNPVDLVSSINELIENSAIDKHYPMKAY